MDLFDCYICLNNMLDRAPRSLHCLHSFCTECLDQLNRNSVIECPTCREVTVLKSGEVTELKVSFMLGKMKEREQAQGASMKDQKIPKVCQICEKTALYKCDECSNLLCLICRGQHDDMDVFRGHCVSDIDESEEQPMCEKHGEQITHLCRECISPLCMKCMFLDHTFHKNYFVSFMDGIERINADLQEKVKSQIQKLDETFETNVNNFEIIQEIKTGLEKRRTFYLETVGEATKLLKQLEEHDKMFKTIRVQYYNERNQHTKTERALNHVVISITVMCVLTVIN